MIADVTVRGQNFRVDYYYRYANQNEDEIRLPPPWDAFLMFLTDQPAFEGSTILSIINRIHELENISKHTLIYQLAYDSPSNQELQIVPFIPDMYRRWMVIPIKHGTKGEVREAPGINDDRQEKYDIYRENQALIKEIVDELHRDAGVAFEMIDGVPTDE